MSLRSSSSLAASNLAEVESFRIPFIYFFEALEFGDFISDSVLYETELLYRRRAGLLKEFLKNEVSFIVVEKLDCEGLRCYFVPRLIELLLLFSILGLERLPLVFLSLSDILLAILDLVGGGLGRFLVSLQ